MRQDAPPIRAGTSFTVSDFHFFSWNAAMDLNSFFFSVTVYLSAQNCTFGSKHVAQKTNKNILKQEKH
jgi:hypothetical protein